MATVTWPVAPLLRPYPRAGTREGAGDVDEDHASLKAGHGVFLYQLDRLEELAHRSMSLEILAAVVETIASAEAHHAMIEDRVLDPALVQANGGEFTLLRKAAAEQSSSESS